MSHSDPFFPLLETEISDKSQLADRRTLEAFEALDASIGIAHVYILDLIEEIADNGNFRMILASMYLCLTNFWRFLCSA